MMKRESKGCVIPMHAELKVGTLAGVLRQADVSPEVFIEASRGRIDSPRGSTCQAVHDSIRN